jgi:hypothetical protein
LCSRFTGQGDLHAHHLQPRIAGRLGSSQVTGGSNSSHVRMSSSFNANMSHLPLVEAVCNRAENPMCRDDLTTTVMAMESWPSLKG